MKSRRYSRLLALICLIIASVLNIPALHAAPGDLDPLDVTIGGSPILTTVVQPDGKILIGGGFTSVQGVPRNKIARLNADGTLDMGFNPNANATVESIVVQPDGKILIGGYFSTLQPDPAGPVVTRRGIARLNADGSLDMGFDPSTDREVLSMVTQADGKIVIVGRFTSLTPNGGSTLSRTKIARLNVDGSLDTGFSVNVTADIYNVALQGDGKILVGGDFSGIGGTTRAGNARLNTNGSVDTSFASAGYGAVNSTAVQADGKILIGGAFGIDRLDAYGVKDSSFSNPKANDTVYGMAVQADGKILTVGYFTTFQPSGAAAISRGRIARLHPDGSVDMNFDPKANGYINSIAVQAGGEILIGGNFSSLQSNGAGVAIPRAGFARLLNDPAQEGLTVPTTNQVTWSRGGSSPEFGRVTFELSTDDGATWTMLGNGTRVGVTPNWQITGISLPADGKIRARGVTCDANGSNGGLLESITTFSNLAPLPEIAVFAAVTVSAREECVDNTGTHVVAGSRTFMVKNTGLANLTGLELTMSGADAGDFSPGSLGATTLAPGATTTFTVTFTSLAADVHRAVVNLSCNDADENPFRINLSNATPAMAVSLGSSTIVNGATPGTNFLSVAISGADPTRSNTFTIANNGTGDLNIGKVVVGGLHSQDFTVSKQPLSPVPPFRSTTFTIVFNPSALGLRNATVGFSSNDPDDNPFGFDVRGTGTALSIAELSDLSLTPGTLSPAFSSTTTSYTATVPYGQADIRVSRLSLPINSSSVDVRVNGGSYTPFSSGYYSAHLPLNVGANAVEVRVTAQDGTTTKTYLITVTRSAAVSGGLDGWDPKVDGGSVHTMAVQPDGKTIIGGAFSSVLGIPRRCIARLHADGTLDLGFDPNPDGEVDCVALQKDGRVILGGRFTTLQPNGAGTATARQYIARVNADGTLDNGFDPSPNGLVTNVALQADGKVIFGGGFTTLQPNGAAAATTRNRIARVNANGMLDEGFDPSANNEVSSIVVQPDGKVLLGGWFSSLQPNGAAAETARDRVARVNADGTLDAGFDPKADGSVSCVVLQSDGKVLLGGKFTALQPNGAGTATTRQYIARVNADGTLDAGFDPKASYWVNSIAQQADGKVLLGGHFTTLQPNGASTATARQYIARVNANGTLDAGFDPKATGSVSGIALQADGAVLLGGVFSSFQSSGGVTSIARNRFARIVNDPAVESLTMPAANRIEWLRSGSSPEVGQVTFELSTDRGTSYTTLGEGVRMNGGWELTGLSSPQGQIRARGRTSGGDNNGSSGLVEMVASFGVAGLPEIVVSGNGVSIPNGAAVPALADHSDFGSASVSGSGGLVTRIFTIANTGSTDLVLGSVAISGLEAADFVVNQQPVSPVPASRSTTFAITFDPSDVGLRHATVSFSSGDADESPFSFGLQGTGFLSSNADLSALGSNSAAPLSPGFSSAVTAYATGVSYGNRSITMTPVLADPNATVAVRINGGGYAPVASGSSSGALLMDSGVNTVEVRVTAQDGITTKAYMVTVTCEAAVAGDLDLPGYNIVGGTVYAMAEQPDGKTVIAGNFTSVLGVPRTNIARLNANGTLDLGFDVRANNFVYSLALQADGKVLLGGSFTTVQPMGTTAAVARNRIARLHADGTLDVDFDPKTNGTVSGIALQPDGRILLGGTFTSLQPNGAVSTTTRNRMARLNADGTLDPTFDPKASGEVAEMEIQPDGKILIGGTFTTLQPNGAATTTARQNVARLNTDGTLDAGFDPNANSTVSAITLQADGKILLGGLFTALQPNGAVSATSRQYVARVNADGTLDSGFDPKANSQIISIALQADGKVLLGGNFTTLQPNGAAATTTRRYVARVSSEGVVDATFDPNANGMVSSVVLLADGRVLLGGSFSALQPNGAATDAPHNRFARLLNEPATQTLGAVASTQVSWARGGSSPEVSQVEFELSTDGMSYLPLGSATRVGTSSDWQLTGISLPAGGLLRARGRTSAGYRGGSSGVVEAVVPFGNFATPIAMWRATYFGSSANSGNAADTSDFDKDGLVNLIEYAFGLNPTVPDGGLLPQVQRMGGALAVSFTRPAGVSGVTYGAEWSEDLETWVPLSDSGTSPQHVFSVPTEGRENLFMRLSVSAP